MRSFLKPLTAEKEQEYILRYYGEQDMEARRLLIEHNMRLVAHVIKKYSFLEKDVEELLSIGCIGLIKAINTYDPVKAKNTKLATYAGRCIENEILMYLRVEKKLSREVSLYDPIGKDKEGNEISLIDVIECEYEDVIDQMSLSDDIVLLKKYFSEVLTKREREILSLRFGLHGKKEKTQKEIATEYGISRSYVSRIEKRALLKLRQRFLQDQPI